MIRFQNSKTHLFNIIKPILNIVYTLLNPKDRDKRKLQSLYARLDKLQKERDEIISKTIKLPKTSNPAILGAVLDDIYRVRKKISNLKG
jgi:hypothetical protein